MDDVLPCSDEGEHPAIFFAVLDESLDCRAGPFLGCVFFTVGDDGHKDCRIFYLLDVLLELLDGLADGIEQRSAAAGIVLLEGEFLGLGDGRLIVDHVDSAATERSEGDEVLLGVQMFELGSLNGTERLVVAVYGLLADTFHRTGFVEDYKVENLGLCGGVRLFHCFTSFKGCVISWDKVRGVLFHFVVQV